MTKTEYRDYISSDKWQQTRQEFLVHNNKCNECHIPRWLAKIVYDQDLHVHHLSYKSLGNEIWDDLEALCRRCHEIKTFGHSQLKPPKTFQCCSCNEPCFDPYLNPPFCAECYHIEKLQEMSPNREVYGGVPLWKHFVWLAAWSNDFDRIVDYLAELQETRNKKQKT